MSEMWRSVDLFFPSAMAVVAQWAAQFSTLGPEIATGLLAAVVVGVPLSFALNRSIASAVEQRQRYINARNVSYLSDVDFSEFVARTAGDVLQFAREWSEGPEVEDLPDLTHPEYSTEKVRRDYLIQVHTSHASANFTLAYQHVLDVIFSEADRRGISYRPLPATGQRAQLTWLASCLHDIAVGTPSRVRRAVDPW